MNTLKILASAKEDGVSLNSSCLHGEYITLCNLIGFEAVEKLYTMYCGGYMNFAKKFLSDEFVHSYIVDCHKRGRKPKEIAREFDYTYGWVLQIIKMSKKK